ncbi:MAG: hypothetical protein ABJC13_22385 [Acidobacteriota bacterium]
MNLVRIQESDLEDLGETPEHGALGPPANEGRLRLALEAFLARESRGQAPEGEWRQGLWFPSANEHRPCCDAFTPTPANKQALESHCRSAAHVAALFEVPALELRRALRRARYTQEEAPTSRPASPAPRSLTNTERLARVSRAARSEAFEAVRNEARGGDGVLRALENLAEDASAAELSSIFQSAAAFVERLSGSLDNAAQMEMVFRVSESAVLKGRALTP